MTDFLKVLQQAQVDKNVSQRNPVGSPTDGENEITLTEQDIDNANKPQGRLVKDPTNVINPFYVVNSTEKILKTVYKIINRI